MRTPRRSFTTDAHGQILAADAAARGASRTQLQRQAATGALTRPFRGLYLVPGVDDPHRSLRAAMVHVGEESVAVLGSASLVQGLAGLPKQWTPQVALPPGLERRQRAGVELHTWDLPPHHVEQVADGHGADLAATTVLRTLADVCRMLPEIYAVSLVDSALDRGKVRPEDFPDVLGLMARRRSCIRGRRALQLARVGAQSPGETRTRLILSAAGLPPDELQVPVHSDEGRLVGRGDLGYALPGGGWVIVEFDGRSVHELPEALLYDRRRQNAFQARADITMFRFAWEDTRHPDVIPGVIGPVLRAANWRAGRYRP